MTQISDMMNKAFKKVDEKESKVATDMNKAFKNVENKESNVAKDMNKALKKIEGEPSKPKLEHPAKREQVIHEDNQEVV